MGLAITLSRYIVRQFSAAVLAMLSALTLLVALFDFIELLRRAATRPAVGFSLVSQIAALRLPWEAMQILPFAVLLGGIVAFWRLTRSSELIVARASGLSAWQFLAAPIACAVAFGAFATGALSPLSAVLYARAERLDSLYLQSGGGPLSLAGGQLWLRQVDRALAPEGVAILHALEVTVRRRTLTARSVSIFRLGPDDALLQRVEATSARLAPGAWVLEGARVLLPGRLPDPPRRIELATDLTVGRVEESFASPDTLSFWRLPGFIALLDRSGFSALRHRLRYQTLLALPVLTAAMALVAAGFSMRPARRGGVARMIAGGVAAGFALFMVSKIAEEFGDSGALPVVLAAWAPALAGLLLAISLLLHLEDG